MLRGLKEMPRPKARVWVSQWNGSIKKEQAAQLALIFRDPSRWL
jgi:hypothetical protein